MNPYKKHDEIILSTKSQTRKGSILYMKYVLVLDVAKGKSMLMLSSNAGEVLLEPTEYVHNKANFDLINHNIDKLNIKDNLTVVMEATSIYHKAPERFFKENDYHVIVFNPLIVKEITNTIRKTKTDKQDCIKLTNLFWKGSISINYHGPISERGNRYARKILFNCSRNIIILSAKHYKENPIYIYYQKKKQEVKHYYACLTACSTKLIRIIYALCMNNSTEQN